MSVDGRTARRNRNRDAVLDAAIDLFTEGHFPPTPTDLAERSGVSLRSVYRYFGDQDALVVAAVGRFVERHEGLFLLDLDSDLPLGERIEGFVAARMRLFEAVAPVVRVVLQQGTRLPVLAERLRARRGQLAIEVRTVFAPEVVKVGEDVLDAVDALTNFEAVEYLRVHRGLSSRRTSKVLVAGLERLLGA